MITEEKIIELLEKYERLSKKELKKLMLKGDKDYVPVEETLKKLKRDRGLLKDKLGRYYLAGKTAPNKTEGKEHGKSVEIAVNGQKSGNEKSGKAEKIKAKVTKGKKSGKAGGKGKGKANGREFEGKIALIRNKYAFFEGEGGERIIYTCGKTDGGYAERQGHSC